MAEREHPVRRLARVASKSAKTAADQLEFELVRFKAEKEEIEFNVDFTHDTVWATQQQMATLFGVDGTGIAKQLKGLFDSKELEEGSVCEEFTQTGPDGNKHQIRHYNLDAILAVGFKVSSAKAIAFRKWATQTLRAYLVDGFVLNEARLKDDPNALRKLAAKIRQLRADEKNIYAAVRECFKISSSDYDKDAKETRSFYARLQDKFLFAITGKTASQIIIDRASHKKPDMGVKSTKGARVTVQDAQIGKNYLDSDELYVLHILCEQFLLYAESKAVRGQSLTMKSLDKKLDGLLAQNEYPVFGGYKDYFKDKAIEHAKAEFAVYQKILALANKQRG